MSPPYVTANGLQIPTEQQMMQSVTDEVHADIDANLDMSADSVEGRLSRIFVNRLRELAELVSIAYNAFNPDASEDFPLDALSAITGTKRPEAKRSQVVAKLNLDANKTIPAGAIFAQHDNPSVQFISTADVTSTTAGNYTVTSECTVFGAVVCNAGTLTDIITPFVGLNSVTNEEDAIVGNARFTDPELRVRRFEELRARGGGTTDAIAAALLELRAADGSAPIDQAICLENVTDYVSADLLPAHSVEGLIFDGIVPAAANNAVAQIVFDRKPAGAPTYGNASGVAIDKNGASHTTFFSRPAIVTLKMAITVEIPADDPSAYAGDQAVKDAIALMFGIRGKLGVRSIRCKNYEAAAQALKGVLGADVQINNILLSGYPGTDVDFALAAREKASLDTSNIEVTTVEVVP